MTHAAVSQRGRLNGTAHHAPAIMYVVGTRPNFVKMAPVFHRLRARLPAARHVSVHTGQHYDREMSAVFLTELDVPGGQPRDEINQIPERDGAQTRAQHLAARQ